MLLKVFFRLWLKRFQEKRLVCVISDFKRPEFTQVGLSCKPGAGNLIAFTDHTSKLKN